VARLMARIAKRRLALQVDLTEQVSKKRFAAWGQPNAQNAICLGESADFTDRGRPMQALTDYATNASR